MLQGKILSGLSKQFEVVYFQEKQTLTHHSVVGEAFTELIGDDEGDGNRVAEYPGYMLLLGRSISTHIVYLSWNCT